MVHLSESNRPRDPEREAQPAVEMSVATDPSPAEQSPHPIDSPLLFQDWTIRRAERRMRRLFLAFILVTAGAGGWLAILQANINELSEAAAVEARDTAVERAKLRRTLFGTADQTADTMDVIGDIQQRLSRIQEAVTELRRDRSRLARCVSKELREVDRNLRRLLARDIRPNRYLAQPRPRRCR